VFGKSVIGIAYFELKLILQKKPDKQKLLA